MNRIRIKFLLVSAAALGLSGCAFLSSRDPEQVISREREALSPAVAERSAYAFHRALPTRFNNVVQPAHYQHVFIEASDPAAVTVQTISLEDAVASNVLASAELQVRQLQPVGGAELKWVVLDRDFRRPSELEGVAGSDAQMSNFRELKFRLGSSEILDKPLLDDLLRLASRTDGVFYVVGFADESGVEAKNKTLSLQRARSVAQYLQSGGVHPSRIKASGVGISRIYQELEDNRRVSVSFLVEAR